MNNEALENSDMEQPNFDFSRFNEVIQHNELLDELLRQIGAVDFMAQANPNNADNFKLQRKHYLIVTIETILQLAQANKWGLCIHNGFVHLFNGEYWAVIESDQLKLFLGEAAEKMGVPYFDARYYEFRRNLLEQFQERANLPAPDIDPNKVLINLKNGTFEITPYGSKLRDFSPLDFMTYQLPFEYDPQATAPLFDAYLNRVLPDVERQNILSEYMGYLFIKHGSGLKLEKALILYGTGANGKSVFFEIVNALLGNDNVSSYSLQSLTNENGYYRAKLANKLVNYASEINGKLETSIFKQLVSGEPVEARLPYGEPFMLTNYAKLIFNCNELPKEVEQTDAFFRRFLIVPFDVTIPPDEQDKSLHSKIIENELSGIFNWVLRGLDRLLKQRGFSHCEAATRAVEKYRTESDSVKMFLNDYFYQPSPSNDVTLSAMYSEYKTYCLESGLRQCSLRTFSDRLSNAGYHKTKRNYGVVVYAERQGADEPL
jgi:putative DNA primase/helicase